jgi:hypothetical protein
MKRSIIILLLLVPACIVSSQSPVVAPAQKRPVMLTGGTIHTGTGEVIENGIIAFSAGKITAAGKEENSGIDRREYEIIDVKGKQIYPGLIYPGTSLGLVEIGGVSVTVDNRELGDLNPNVRSIVAYNTDSHVIPVIRSNGILLAQIVPTGTLLPGTSSIVQLDAWNWKDAAYKTDNGIHLGWPRKSPGSTSGVYEKNIELLEKIFSDAVAYAATDSHEDINPRLEALKGLFDGSKILFITAGDPKSIIASVSFARRFNVKKIVLTNADESAWMVRDFLKENNIPVIIENTMSLPKYDYSDIRLPFKLPAMMMKAGILTGLTYSPTAYGNLPFAAGLAAAYGITGEEALELVTLNNAKILGIDDMTGSLEKGKDANIVVSSGDILDMATSNIELAYIAGRKIDLDNKHKQLYRRFMTKYETQKNQ